LEEGWRLSVQEALERARRQGAINAVVTVNEGAEGEAARLEASGVTPRPIGVKDIIFTAGLRTTMGSRLFSDYVPAEDATVVARLRRAGYVVIGKTNTHEFASGATTTSSIFGPTRNPHDPDRIAGGSSGGSAAAVAAGVLDAALGTDTAGSARIPASLCGVYGMRPSPGLVPRGGVFPLAPTFDEVGVIARDLKVLRDVMTAIARYVRRPEPVSQRPRIGVPRGLMRASREVEEAFWDVISGFDYVEVRLPTAERLGAWAFSVIRLSEASRVHLRYRDRWGEYFPDVRRLLERGLQYSAVDYVEAREVLRRVRAEVRRALREVDVIAMPTTPVEAPRLDEVLGREDEVRSTLTANTWLSPMAGLPAITLPLMKVRGLPVGLDLMGRGDWELIEVAEKVVENTL